MTLYTDLRAANCELDHHESNLYVKATAVALEILQSHGKRVDGRNVQRFRSQIDGAAWYDIPFAYDPFWEQKSAK